MAKKIQIKSANDDGTLIMYAKPAVLKEKKSTEFEIVNKVKSTEPILIRFYKLDDKGKQGKVLSNFCDSMPDPKILTINEGGSFNCKVSSPSQKYFAYTVENKDAAELDPVIIIEDFGGGGGLLFSLAAIIVTGVGGIVLGALGFALFTRKGRAKASSE